MLGVAFILVSVPLFYQVRADAVESKQVANNSLLSRVFRDLLQDLAKDPPKDLQVEDAWQKWQEENPDCGPECDPDADPDGDGRSNRDEVKEGRNPACNEEREGREYCSDQPKSPPPGNDTLPLDDLLFEEAAAGATFAESFNVALVVPEYDRWIVTWRLSGYQGVTGQYSIAITNEGTRYCCEPQMVDFLSDGDSGSETLEGDELPPSGATYQVQVQSQNAVAGTWQIQVRGVRDAVTEPVSA